MGRRLLLIQGHPDPCPDHLCHTLADAYASGAIDAGHELRFTTVALLNFPVLRSQRDWERGSVPEGLRQSQADILWCEHMVLFFPLWLGDMPALFKAFLEQVARPGFAFEGGPMGAVGKKPLAGRSARAVVTMGMPAMLYRFYFGAHSIKSLRRNVMAFMGVEPVRESLIGTVERAGVERVAEWVREFEVLGREAC